MIEPEPYKELNFNNTEIAFASKSDKELSKTAWLFRMMNNHQLVKLGSKFGLLAIKLNLPFTEYFVKKTIFPQFCGGENLMDCQKTIDKLYDSDILTILDYGAEGKSDEDDLDAVMNETINAIEMAASNNSVPVVASKITGLIDIAILEKMNDNQPLDEGEARNYQHLVERLDEICARAKEHKVAVFIDAEESWIQGPIDDLVIKMMLKYNGGTAIVHNTYQTYLTNRLQMLKDHHKYCQENGVLFGTKTVRGAYLDKENERAIEMGYPTPIQPSKAATDAAYNAAIAYCVLNVKSISSCCASHNMDSNLLQAKLISEHGLDLNHPHINFCQLYGMTDNITYNLSNAGYNAAKYVVYGPIKDVVPYLIRRTEENSSITGEMGRELSIIQKEMTRRGLR